MHLVLRQDTLSPREVGARSVACLGGGISPFASLWTCTLASESAGSSASFLDFCFNHTSNGRFLAGKGTFNAYFQRKED